MNGDNENNNTKISPLNVLEQKMGEIWRYDPAFIVVVFAWMDLLRTLSIWRHVFICAVNQIPTLAQIHIEHTFHICCGLPLTQFQSFWLNTAKKPCIVARVNRAFSQGATVCKQRCMTTRPSKIHLTPTTLSFVTLRVHTYIWWTLPPHRPPRKAVRNSIYDFLLFFSAGRTFDVQTGKSSISGCI